MAATTGSTEATPAATPPQDGLSFLFRAIPHDMDTLEAVPVCVIQQAWGYVTPEEIHPQLCAFRKVYNEDNPFFLVEEREPAPIRRRNPPLLSAADHAALLTEYGHVKPRKYEDKFAAKYPNVANFLNVFTLGLLVGVALVISGSVAGQPDYWISGVCVFGVSVVVLLGHWQLCSWHDRRQQAALDAIKNRQLEPLQRAAESVNGSCVSYRWRVQQDAADCNLQLYLDVLDSNRLATLAAAAAAAATAAPAAASGAASAPAPYYPMADGTDQIEGWPMAIVVDAPVTSTSDAVVDIPSSPVREEPAAVNPEAEADPSGFQPAEDTPATSATTVDDK